MYGGFENYSALLRAGIVETVPPEYSDHFLVDVSRYIKAHPDCTKKIEDMSASIEVNIRSIEDIENRLSVLNEYQHLNDIDRVWFDVETHKKEILELQNAKTDSIKKIKWLDL